MPAPGLGLLARGDEGVAQAHAGGDAAADGRCVDRALEVLHQLGDGPGHAVDGESSALAPAFVRALQRCGLRWREPAARRFVGQAVAERRAVLGPLDGPHGSDDRVELPAAESRMNCSMFTVAPPGARSSP